MSDAQSPADEYPGDTATPEQLRKLADEYLRAAKTTRERIVQTGKRYTWAPTRLLYVHAMELYLNAWLRKKGKSNEDLRAMNHSFADRLDEAKKLGLQISDRTCQQLEKIEEIKEYVVIRYGPEKLRKLPNPSHFEYSIEDIRNAVLSDFGAPKP